eukprot:GSChrysophyteH2.ASY1.ANO1.626.1 assembled CDS
MFSEGGGAADAQLTAEQPNWQKDEDWTNCRECNTKFDAYLKRKHHCRHCGYIFCGKCTSGRCLLPVHFNKHDPTRVCNNCFMDLQPQQEAIAAQNSNAERDNDVDLAAGSLARYMNMPYSSTMGSEIRKAAYSMHNLFTSDWLEDKSIPAQLLANCCGIAFMTVAKAGFIFAGKVGTGLVVGRLPNGTWSAPSAIGTVGMSWGALIGAEVTDFVVILRTMDALKAFSGLGNIQLGAGVDVALGPVGRGANGSLNLGDQGLAPVLSYAHSKGLFAGLSLDGAVIATRPSVNFKFYGAEHNPMELLTGAIAQPKAGEPLYTALAKYNDSTGGTSGIGSSGGNSSDNGGFDNEAGARAGGDSSLSAPPAPQMGHSVGGGGGGFGGTATDGTNARTQQQQEEEEGFTVSTRYV